MTIAGAHTIAETKDYQAQTEWRIDGLNDALAKVKRENPSAIDTDPTLPADWNTFLARWVAAKGWTKTKYVAAMIANPILGVDVFPNEDGYQALVHAVSVTMPYTDHDLPGLQNRITKIGGIFDNGPMPKGYAIDLDLAGYKAADSGAKTIQAAKTAVVTAKNDFIAENKGAIALTVVGAGLALYFANKYL